MSTYRAFGINRIVRGVYNPGEGAGAGAGAGDGSGAGEQKPQVFTQEQVNQFIAAEKRKEQEKTKKLVEELNTLKQASGNSTQRVEELEGAIKTLEATYLTKEELAKRDLDKAQKEAKAAAEKLQSENEFWKNRFTGQLVSTALTQAAVANDAYAPEQILTLLGGQSKVQKVIKDGKETGDFEVKIVFNDQDKDGNALTLELTPDAALKRMKELPKRFGNLFKGAVSGLGGDNNGPDGTTGNQSLSAIAKKNDPVAYREARKNNKQ